MMQAIVACPKPVIAAVQGTATAAGCQLVATCDLAVAAERRQVLHPRRQHRPLLLDADGGAIAQRVAQARDGDAAAGRDALGAEEPPTTASSTGRAGAHQVLAEALSLAAKIAAKSPLTVAIGKAAFYAQAEMPLKEAYAYAAKVMVDNMMARDAEEGIGAFLEKRKPEWKGS